jgi:hypothetical protein
MIAFGMSRIGQRGHMNAALYYLLVGAAIFALLVYALWDLVAKQFR